MIRILFYGTNTCMRINGFLTKYFSIEMEVRQDSLLASYIFTIVGKILNLMI